MARSTSTFDYSQKDPVNLELGFGVLILGWFVFFFKKHNAFKLPPTEKKGTQLQSCQFACAFPVGAHTQLLIVLACRERWAAHTAAPCKTQP